MPFYVALSINGIALIAWLLILMCTSTRWVENQGIRPHHLTFTVTLYIEIVLWLSYILVFA